MRMKWLLEWRWQKDSSSRVSLFREESWEDEVEGERESRVNSELDWSILALALDFGEKIETFGGREGISFAMITMFQALLLCNTA